MILYSKTLPKASLVPYSNISGGIISLPNHKNIILIRANGTNNKGIGKKARFILRENISIPGDVSNQLEIWPMGYTSRELSSAFHFDFIHFS